MSLKSINFIIKAFSMNITALRKVNAKCEIYLKQILNYFKHRGIEEFITISKHFEPVPTKNSHNVKKFKKCAHYLLLQEIDLHEELEQPLNAFQSDIEQVLSHIDLFSYNLYSKVKRPIEELRKLLKQVIKYPMKHVLDPKKVLDIQILANKLYETIKEHNISDETLYQLLDYYTRKASEHNNNYLFILRVTIQNLKNRYMHIKGRKKHLKNYILPKLIVEQIIETEKFPFEIYANSPSDKPTDLKNNQ